jgi:transcriptional regulator with XRE-family HTH domain
MKRTIKTEQRNIIGGRVRQARLKQTPTVSQDDLAGKLAGQGILLDRTAISRIESQTRYVMDYEAAAIARALKVSVAWLYGEQGETLPGSSLPALRTASQAPRRRLRI